MKNTISITFDEEKLSALRIYLAQKNSDVEKELENAIENLYAKTVPTNVRSYIELKSESKPMTVSNQRKPKKEKPVEAPPQSEENAP